MYSQAHAMDKFPHAAPPLYSARNPAAGDDLGPKIIVIDTDRRLVEATAGGRALLARGDVLRRCFDQVRAATRADAGRLIAALALATMHGHAHMGLEGTGERVAADLVTMQADGKGTCHVMIILKLALEERRQRLCSAESRYGLTRAEARLLATLFEGCSIPEAADRLGVARSTARTHLQRVFDKTGARRQGDLLRLVGCE